ncbi:MAG: hypothetical protein HY762_03990, partial [Planctomycetes bacterium]|nr:hypothetical protein [Planctomycetota bacterium]
YVMVDDGTASASEILSGVLQDYKKAVIVGKNTYGKGSVQHIFELGTTNKQTALRLTVAKYYLPSGRSIHRTNGVGGVEPDIKALDTERDLGKEYEFNKLIDSGELDKYLDTHYMANHDRFVKLADDDGLDYKRYPEFDNLYGKLKIRLDKDEVREAVREHLRRRVADERGSEFMVDVQQDAVLQRSIVEADKTVNLDPDDIPLYNPFANKFDKSAAGPDKKEKEAVTPK